MITKRPDFGVAEEKQKPGTGSGVSLASGQMAGPNHIKKEIRKQQVETSENSVYLGNPTSINAIFFASILLSSRLNKTSKVFTLLYISLCIFGFVPIFRHMIRHRLRTVYDVSAFISSVLLVYFVSKVNFLFGLLYFGLIVFITLLSPLIFIYAYQFKNDIRGPWDCPQIKQYTSL
jgi:hypothetical protein